MNKLVYIVPDVSKCKIGSDYTKSEWYQIPEENKKFITAIAKGSEVEFQSKDENGKKVLTFIKAIGTGESEPAAKTTISKPTSATGKTTSSGPVCEDCGAGLKDDSYKTCYKCSMVRKEKEAKSPEGLDRQRSIEVQAMIKSASDVVGTAVAGQVNFAEPTQATALAEFVVIVATKLLAEFDSLKKK